MEEEVSDSQVLLAQREVQNNELRAELHDINKRLEDERSRKARIQAESRRYDDCFESIIYIWSLFLMF